MFVPRQTGKTTEIRAIGTHSAGVLGRDVFYTAQTGKDARARWLDLVTAVRTSPVWRDKIKVTLRGGSEEVTFFDRAGFHVFAPTPESLHGYTPPKVFIDEAFALSAIGGELLMGAIGPAQVTIRDKQIWIVSTAGTAESVFLHDWIERALGGMARVAIFYWGADDNTDPFTLEGIERFHPGVGFLLNGKVLTAADVLSNSERMSRGEYERAFGNRRTNTRSNLIPTEVWRALADPQLAPPADTREVTLTYDVALDRLSSSIVATWPLGYGRVAGKVVQAGPGTSWLAPAVDQIVRSWRPAELAAADNGPVLDVTAQLRDIGHDITTLGEREFAAASGTFLSRVDDRRLVHDGSDVLEVSATGLVTRGGAVDGVALSRRHSVGDSSSAIALAVGVWITERRNGEGKPLIYFAS